MKNLKFGVNTWLWASPFTTDSISLFPKIKVMGFDFVEIPVENPELIDPIKVKIILGMVEYLSQSYFDYIGIFEPKLYIY